MWGIYITPNKATFFFAISHEASLSLKCYKELWVKCDMIYTVSFERLDKLHRKTRAKGREYFVPRLDTNDMRGVISGVKAYLPL